MPCDAARMVAVDATSHYTIGMCQCHLPVLTDGPAIRAIREQAGYGLREFATRIGSEASHLSRIERGRIQPHAKLRNRIAIGLGVTVGEITFVPQLPPRVAA